MTLTPQEIADGWIPHDIIAYRLADTGEVVPHASSEGVKL